MNRIQPENVHSTIFTPQEYQVELINSCLQRNTVVVLASKLARTFLVTMVTRELSYQTRSSEQGGFDRRTLIIGKSGPKLVKAGEAIQQNTNLSVATYTSLDQVNEWRQERWEGVLAESQVVVMASEVLETGIKCEMFGFENLNLFVLTDAHQMLSSESIKKLLKNLPSSCRILVITSPVLSYSKSPSSLDSILSYLKEATGCYINTSSEIVAILRYVNKMHEKVIMCSSPHCMVRPSLEEEVRELTSKAMSFLDDHRYNLVEIYGEEYAEFCVGIPDPIQEPKNIINDFLYVLDHYGLWCADRAALFSLVEIEKLKKKTAYDRHYLLLCLIFTALARIRAVIESAFDEHSDLDQILKFSTPKILRFIEILREIRPLNFVDPRKRRDKEKSDETTRSELEGEMNPKTPVVEVPLKSIEEERGVDRTINDYSCECKAKGCMQANSNITDEKDSKINGDLKQDSDTVILHTSCVEDLDNQNGCENHLVTNCKPSNSIENTNGTNSSYERIGSEQQITEIFISDKISKVNEIEINDKLIDPIISMNEDFSTMNNSDPAKHLVNGKTDECNNADAKESATTTSYHTTVASKQSHSSSLNEVLGEEIALNNLGSSGSCVAIFPSQENHDELNFSNNCSCNCHVNPTNVSSITASSHDTDFSEHEAENNANTEPDSKNLTISDSEILRCNSKVSSEKTAEEIEKSDSATEFGFPLTSSEECLGKEKKVVSSSSCTDNVQEPSSESAALTDTLAQLLPYVTRVRRRREDVREKVRVHKPEDPDSVCGIIFVKEKSTAKIVYRLLKELSDVGGEFNWIFPQFTVELCKNASDDLRAAENEHKKQEEVLRRFRHHECNLLVSTSVLEHGIDIPNCNLVIRFDPPSNYSSYIYSRGRARGIESFYLHLVSEEEREEVSRQMASYASYDAVLLSEFGRVDEPMNIEKDSADIDQMVPPYVTLIGASVSMTTSIALLNKYCAKLPSDTFTCLTPMWRVETSSGTEEGGEVEYQCFIWLPINSPLKGCIKGLWMSNECLAKMSAALVCCSRLHQIGELSEYLLPVGKESMDLDSHLCAPMSDDCVSEGMPRPGSTKRRQYYYKKAADCLLGKELEEWMDLCVYKFEMVLTCPIPEEQNTRGRKIYRPESTPKSFGIVTSKPIPQLSGFPVFTRSGEVMVRVKEVSCSHINVSSLELEAIKSFHMFTFSHVLRLEKYPVKFDPQHAKTSFYIVPLVRESIDWDFVKLIDANKNMKLDPPNENVRKDFKFESSSYLDAVVMPWYRNQDQPQYFYVAEICSHLHPQSDFPDEGFESFEKYYLTKYGLKICNLNQPLLDVDHTSGRLNLLTPRHVNRKGVALPTTSEETKRAKRENLQQKQILVPELCTIHPFPASLWRKAVCLPTILYRINGLLLADELRVRVAREIGLGTLQLTPGFGWPNLDFGWTLADVLAKNSELKKQKEKSALESVKKDEEITESLTSKKSTGAAKKRENGPRKGSGTELEIGTWSNDMALSDCFRDNEDDFEIFDPSIELPDNLTILDGSCGLGDDVEGELGADWGTGLTERKTTKCCRRDSSDGAGGIVRVGSPSNFEAEPWDSAVSGDNSSPYFTCGSSNYDGYGDFDEYESDQEEEEFGDDGHKESSETESKGHKVKCQNGAEYDEEDEVDMEWANLKDIMKENLDKEKEFECLIEQKKMELLCNREIFLPDNEPLIIEKSFRKNPKPVHLTNDNSSQTEEKLFEVAYVVSPLSTAFNISKSNVESSGISNEATNFFGSNEGKIDVAVQTDFILPSEEISTPFNVNRRDTLLGVEAACKKIMTLPGGINEEELFSFDYQPDLFTHAGPSPSVILQALTMSNANDGVNLERLETIGDSFLKYAITNYLYCLYPKKHEGKLSYLRSKQVSNLNLYRLGKRKRFGECMIATKFEPHDNWLPTGYFVPKDLEEALIDSGVPAGHWNMADFPGLHDLDSEQIRHLVHERSEQIKQSNAEELANELTAVSNPQDLPIFIPYNLLTQHSIPDKSISDCVEALIGAYLTTCGPRGALLFMSWLGIKVLSSSTQGLNITYHQLPPQPSPLDFSPYPDAHEQLELMLCGFEEFERKIRYTFRDRAYLLQAFTHASYYINRLTDCYQRLEFLGDAVLDYLITRHLFEDKRQHSPGSLTDLRSALVNNTIFACLAVKFEFHKYFRHFSPGLDRVVTDFVRMQEENGHKINEEYYFMEEEECEAVEDIEVPKALGDVFESVAGAIFVDSGGSLDAVWRVYHFMMRTEIDQFSDVVPKSPIRELLETEPETAKFGKPERLVDGKVRVSVEIFGKSTYTGVGRNYRIAKSTAAKRALRHLKKAQALNIPSSHLSY